ncbi:hypothetical protein DA075_15490 [Methylobacterium currus]|uniref:Uncharacterized protein n=1 Tax=Methylobacterium currus TaxID=2051553 RepID=A0A2R4WKX5_9HYPH|nr:hypothetical protein [Methylobacterium currus]AWB22155.1 hypothetical protein DA075_15490 [Methylobacterium currus]UHC18218.1 hypothetical protein LRS73_10445 [Methylobacterium currus]
MLRPALTAGLMILALAAPAAADGDPDAYRAARVMSAQAGYGRVRMGDAPAYRPVARAVRPHHRPGLVRLRGGPVRPVSYGETDGTVFHAWLPRNTNLPIYNIPPPFFPEP